MKLVSHFNDFLNDIVNLNPTRIDRLENSVDAIQSLIRESDWVKGRITFLRQGSWAHKTIIKPQGDGGFDADLLAVVPHQDKWNAEDYLDSLYDIFKHHGTYSDKVHRWEYCVTLVYKDDFKIDVAPCVKDRAAAGYEVCNAKENKFVSSNPIGYTDWLVEKNEFSTGNSFRKVTRLLKYLRATKGTFTCPSVLLTTLIGDRINSADQYTGRFNDVPSGLKTIIGRLDDWLQLQSVKPQVLNPSLFYPQEDFARLWETESQYLNFRSKINLYRGWIDDAFEEEDRDESIGKWRRVFGADFAKSVDVTESQGLAEKARATLRDNRALIKVVEGNSEQSQQDLVSIVKSYGRSLIPPSIRRLPYLRRPKWRVAKTATTVLVSSELYNYRGGTLIKRLSNSGELLPKGCGILFKAKTNVGLPFPADIRVEWRVTNTDREALADDALRGDFYPSSPAGSRWETLAYRGVHMVEAFAVRNRDDILLGSSDPYYVIIE